jgi:uncharacterized protein (DUF433 family)
METQLKPITISNETPLMMDKYGAIRVGGTRVTLDIVIAAYNRGSTPEEIVKAYDVLNLADVYYAISYYLRNKTEVDQYIREGDEKAAKYEAEARKQQVGLKEKLEARRKEMLG